MRPFSVTREVSIMKRSVIALMGVFLSSLALSSAVQADEQKWCPLCGMNLKMYWKTHHRLTFSDGTSTGYCSIHCAALVYKDRAGEIDRWEVVDYDTEKLTDARKARFLIGSDLPGTMTPVSKLAFASPDTAKRYQEKHGGIVGSFDDALRRTLEGMGEDMALIQKKVAQVSAMGKDLAGKHGCFQCHGESGSGGKAAGWNSPAFARTMDTRVKIKKAILGGSHKMKGYEGKMTEKELHAITVYIWTQRAK
jgi:mono/diheme cytochrome c family protein